MKRLTKRLRPNSTSTNIICQLTKTIPSVSLHVSITSDRFHHDAFQQPEIIHYRNKNEFHLRYDTSGRVVVGLCVGKSSDDTLRCINADRIINTHPTHSEVARHFQDYVQNHSKWRICEHFERGGNWRLLTVRSNHKKELMVIVTIHPQDLTSEEIHSEMERMKDYLLSCPISRLISVYYQTWYF